ncbi:MAG: hypothetical protein WA421_03650, partial [Nitrososphaeraceae archaeon]
YLERQLFKHPCNSLHEIMVEEASYGLALLTRRERDWLLGKIKVSRDYENHMRHRIKRKLEIFSSNELPLLIGQGLITRINNHSMTTDCHDMTISSHQYNPDLGWSSLVKISPQTSQKSKENDAVNRKQHKNKWQDSEMGRVGFESTNPAMSRHIPNENCTRSDDSIGRKRSLEPPYVKPDHFIFNIVNKEEFWIGFGRFLIKTNNPSSSRNRLNYARDYAHILQIGNASELLELSNDKRIHIMKSLSALAKYIGCYDKWQQIRQRFQLKWSNNDSVQAFASIFTNEKDLDHMIVWLKNACSTLPQD